LASTKYWLKVLTAKKISGLALTRYIKDPIYCLYIVGSTKYESEVESLNFFGFFIIGVVMDLQSIISNLISILRMRKIPSDLVTSLIPRVHPAKILHLEL
jgi:hypothetical protein